VVVWRGLLQARQCIGFQHQPPPLAPHPLQIFKPVGLLTKDDVRVAYVVTAVGDCSAKPHGLTLESKHICLKGQEGNKKVEDVVLNCNTADVAKAVTSAVQAAQQKAVILSVRISGAMVGDKWFMGNGLATMTWLPAADKPMLFVSGIPAYKGGALWFDGFSKDQGGTENLVNGKGSAVIGTSNQNSESSRVCTQPPHSCPPTRRACGVRSVGAADFGRRNAP